MIRELPHDHPMAKFATSWTAYAYPEGQDFTEFLDLIELISGVDGNNWEEVKFILNDDNDMVFIHNPPTSGKDWYWAWQYESSRTKIIVFLTTELQSTYFSIAPTEDISPPPPDPDPWGPPSAQAAAIIQAIRDRKNAQEADEQKKCPPVILTDEEIYDRGQTILNRIKASVKSREK